MTAPTEKTDEIIELDMAYDRSWVKRRASMTKARVKNSNFRSLPLRREKVDYGVRDGMGENQSVYTSRADVSTSHAETVLWDLIYRMATFRPARRFDIPRITVESAMMLLLLENGAFDRGEARGVTPLTTARRASKRAADAYKAIKAGFLGSMDGALGLFYDPGKLRAVLRGYSTFVDYTIDVNLHSMVEKGYIKELEAPYMWQSELGLHPRTAEFSTDMYVRAVILYGIYNALARDAMRVPQLYKGISDDVGMTASHFMDEIESQAVRGDALCKPGLVVSGIDLDGRFIDVMAVANEMANYEAVRLQSYRTLIGVVTQCEGTDNMLRRLFWFLDSSESKVLFTDMPDKVCDDSKETVENINAANKHISDFIAYALDFVISITSPYYRYSPRFDLNAVSGDPVLVNSLIDANALYFEGDRVVYTTPTLRSITKSLVSRNNKKTKELA